MEVEKQSESAVSLLSNIQDILDNLTLFGMGWGSMGEWGRY